MAGFGSRTYAKSAEARVVRQQVKDTTAAYQAGDLHLRTELEPLCTCRSWLYPHRLEAHRQPLLRGDWDWPTIEQRQARENARAVEWNRQLR